ncbi:hypothetical protein P7K49_032255, partial [Saguinus oedipus]
NSLIASLLEGPVRIFRTKDSGVLNPQPYILISPIALPIAPTSKVRFQTIVSSRKCSGKEIPVVSPPFRARKRLVTIRTPTEGSSPRVPLGSEKTKT